MKKNLIASLNFICLNRSVLILSFGGFVVALNKALHSIGVYFSDDVSAWGMHPAAIASKLEKAKGVTVSLM